MKYAQKLVEKSLFKRDGSDWSLGNTEGQRGGVLRSDGASNDRSGPGKPPRRQTLCIIHRELGPIVKPAILFVALIVIYAFWMTGLTLRFSETSIFPTYNMLAESFLRGQLNIDQNPPVDYLMHQGKKYLYFGPGPVIFHIPSLILAGWRTPTGVMVVTLLAGCAAVFLAILNQWRSPDRLLGVETGFLSIVFAFNGYSLLMATIPSIHHEAICSGMFFLLSGMYYVLKSVRNSFKFGLVDALISGTCFSLCILSRFSYALTAIAMVLVMIIGKLRASTEWRRDRDLLHVFVLAFLTLGGVAGTLGYNYLRFGNLADFGVGFMETLYRDYFLQGNYFRYDHIPYNIWDYFFRVPQLATDFPYLRLPFYILQAKSSGPVDYFLMHVNELSVSVFVLMPVLFFCLFIGLPGNSGGSRSDRTVLQTLLAAFVLQLAPLSLTIGGIARYYFDFLPIMLLMAFSGYVGIKDRSSSHRLALGLASAASLVFSFCVPINALFFYWGFIRYKSPLLGLW